MLKAFLRWIAYSFAIMFIAWIVPGISVENFWIAMLVSVIIALINTFIKPLIQIITLPINFITLGLFSFVINALLFMLAGAVTPGFTVEGFLSSLFGSILLSLFGIFISKI
ncbi:phage holin family protein [bacterium]|nr:phage holin family protein [bacterium]